MSELRGRLIDDIRRKVLTGEIGVGRENATSEAEIAKGFHETVSRVPVREALTVLADRLLVEQFPQRGIAARRLSLGEALEAIRLCSVIEGSVVSYLTKPERRSKVEESFGAIDALADELQELDFAREKGPDEVLLRETALHRSLARVAGFDTGGRSIQEFRDRTHLYQRTNAPLTDSEVDTVVKRNTELIDAVRGLDGSACESALVVLFDERIDQLTRADLESPELENARLVSSEGTYA
jgi:DNA-binding GntR family transcriptional regulator